MAVTKKRVKKKWFQIVAKGEFDKQVLGESLAHTPQDLVGKHLCLNLGALTNDPRKQSITIDFNVTGVEGNAGVAEVCSYNINSSHVKRIVRKAITKIEDSFVVETKDNVKFRIKPLLISRFRGNKGVASAVRKKTRDIISHSFKKMSSKDVFISVITNKIQMDLKKDIKKISPLAVSEIRVLQKL